MHTQSAKVVALLFTLFLIGCGGGSSATPSTPLAPIGVFAVSGAGKVTVSWSQVGNASSYNIYWGSTAGVTTTSYKIANATSPFVHSNLTPGGTYFYRISSVNAAGESLSDETFSFVYPGGDPAGNFTATGSMINGRYSYTTTRLPNGKVLFTGGISQGLAPGTGTPTAELFDPITGTFAATGSMTTGRYSHTATLLRNGKVLITGGIISGNSTSSAELYNPATGTFAATGDMTMGRYLHTSTLLPNGKVLITGGVSSGVGTSSAELYDSATGNFTASNSMSVIRTGHTATLLSDGTVLIIGDNSLYANSAEIYDPATDSFSLVNDMGAPRPWHTATLLPSGKVLVTGGYSGTTYASAELFDPATRSFTATGNMTTGRYSHAATLLPNGKVLITGGILGAGMTALPLASTEIFDPATGIFAASGNMTTWRFSHSATQLFNGSVLVNKSTADLFQ